MKKQRKNVAVHLHLNQHYIKILKFIGLVINTGLTCGVIFVKKKKRLRWLITSKINFERVQNCYITQLNVEVKLFKKSETFAKFQVI